MTIAKLLSIASWHGQEALRLEHAADIAGTLDRLTAAEHRRRALWHRDTAGELEELAMSFNTAFPAAPAEPVAVS